MVDCGDIPDRHAVQKSEQSHAGCVRGEPVLSPHQRQRHESQEEAAAGLCALVVTFASWSLIDAVRGNLRRRETRRNSYQPHRDLGLVIECCAAESPWLGNGIDAMKVRLRLAASCLAEARHAENELLQQFFAYGVAGIVMLIAIYGSLWRRVRTIRSRLGGRCWPWWCLSSSAELRKPSLLICFFQSG